MTDLSNIPDGPVRELDFDDRATCRALHGQWCHAEVGLQLGVRLDGRRMQTGEGAHLSRFRRAPTHVRETPCDAPPATTEAKEGGGA